tara:strand:+ start:307 stop:579 length:273 start_codon:yes stop_codon:yes gene_type:complete
MFANLLRLISRSAPDAYHHAFVEDVHVRRLRPRRRRAELLIVIGWGIMVVKCWATFWLIERYHIPFSGWWIAGPSLAAALVCTWVYWRRD